MDDGLTLITSESIAKAEGFHGGPYMVIIDQDVSPVSGKITLEGTLKYNGETVRRFMGTDIMLPILLMHAINDHQQQLHGYTPPESRPLQI